MINLFDLESPLPFIHDCDSLKPQIDERWNKVENLFRHDKLELCPLHAPKWYNLFKEIYLEETGWGVLMKIRHYNGIRLMSVYYKFVNRIQFPLIDMPNPKDELYNYIFNDSYIRHVKNMNDEYLKDCLFQFKSPIIEIEVANRYCKRNEINGLVYSVQAGIYLDTGNIEKYERILNICLSKKNIFIGGSPSLSEIGIQCLNHFKANKDVGIKWAKSLGLLATDVITRIPWDNRFNMITNFSPDDYIYIIKLILEVTENKNLLICQLVKEVYFSEKSSTTQWIIYALNNL